MMQGKKKEQDCTRSIDMWFSSGVCVFASATVITRTKDTNQWSSAIIKVHGQPILSLQEKKNRPTRSVCLPCASCIYTPHPGSLSSFPL